MAGNPLIDQGTLNRLRGSITIPDFPALNVTASFLGKAAISMARQGDTVAYIPTLTSAVTSPDVFMMVEASVNLLKTQSLAAQYEAQLLLDARLGDLTIRLDSSVLPDFRLVNSSIKGVRELTSGGEDAGYIVTLGGIYYINNKLWDVV